MVVQSKPLLVSRLQTFSQAAGTAVILIGGLVLVGWLADVTILKNILPGYVTMKANTAVAFILAGLSLWLSKKAPIDPTSRRVAQMTGFAVSLIGLLTLTEYLFGWNLGIDQLLFSDPIGALRTSSPGRMAPTTALNFLMVGSALLMLSRGVGRWWAQGLTLMAAPSVIGVLLAVGWIRLEGQRAGFYGTEEVVFGYRADEVRFGWETAIGIVLARLVGVRHVEPLRVVREHARPTDNAADGLHGQALRKERDHGWGHLFAY